MALYTAALTAQNTSVFICNIHRRNTANDWFATAAVTGTFGGGTVSFQGSFDGGTTKFTLNQDGTASAASVTAAGAINIRLGNPSSNLNTMHLYATIATATNPTLAITVADNQ